jgi:hypothetical protein
VLNLQAFSHYNLPNARDKSAVRPSHQEIFSQPRRGVCRAATPTRSEAAGLYAVVRIAAAAARVH